MAADLEELDLTKPGKLWAKADHERDTTFHLVIPQKAYTKNNLTLNPTINPIDQLMRPVTISAADAAKDKEDIAYADLEPRAAEIMAKLEERYARNEPRVEKVLAIYIATAKDGNRVPDAQVAEVKELKLVSIPGILLKPRFQKLHPNNVKNACCACPLKGKTKFELELQVTGDVTEVELNAPPPGPGFAAPTITANPGGSGKGSLKVACKEGQKIELTISADFKQESRNEQRMVRVVYRRMVPNGWRTQGGRWDMGPQMGKVEVWTGGVMNLRATGTGKNKNLVKVVPLTMETYNFGWIATGMPPVMDHNIC